MIDHQKMFKDEFAESESEFEKVLLKKGSLIVKEFKDCCLFEEDDNYHGYISASDTLGFETASVLDVETGNKVYALRITTGYYNSQYDCGKAVDVMDADEIDGAIKTLEYIKQNIDKMEDYTEVVYETSSGMKVGTYKNAEEAQIFVKVDSKATKYYSVDKIDSLIECLQKVNASFGE